MTKVLISLAILLLIVASNCEAGWLKNLHRKSEKSIIRSNDGCPPFSPFWRRKIATYFQRKDSDGDGKLSEKNYKKVAKRFGEMKTANSAVRKELEIKMMQLYENYANHTDGSKIITENTVVKSIYALRCKNTDQMSPFYHIAYMSFTILDVNEDNLIQRSEFKRLFYNFCIANHKTLSEYAFGSLDTDADGFLTRKDYMMAFRDFFLSDVPSRPGTQLFGPLIY